MDLATLLLSTNFASMQKLLFIDRDGTLIHEPPITFQVDALDKLRYLKDVFYYLRLIVERTDYQLVMVTNQDGLGTSSFPEDTFWPTHNKMMEAFQDQGIEFINVHIDPHFPEDLQPTRKPGIGMLKAYLDDSKYDLENSFVIGDRFTDVQLAQNLGSKAIWIVEESQKENYLSNPSKIFTESIVNPEKDAINGNTLHLVSGWKDIFQLLCYEQRKAKVIRKTSETEINIELNLDGQGKGKISTGLGFFDHMLEQLARHGNIDINVEVNGDLHIDEHHTIEDTGLALGEAFRLALGKKIGISRYGFLLPMDDCLAQVAIDFSGRPWCVWEAEFKREKVGDMPTEMFFHFFKSFSDTAQANLNIKAEGDNEHHKIEAIFKAWARAIRMAIRKMPDADMQLPSTKGVL